MVINELQVLMNNVPVGRLSKNQLGLMSFVYDAFWLEHPARRPISLSLPLSPNPYKGEIVRNYFQNLLPDSETVLSCIQNRLNLPSLHPFDLLAAVGRDCVGALQFYPINEPVPSIEAVTGTPVTDTDIEQLLQSSQEMPLGMSLDFPTTLHSSLRICIYFLNFSKNLLHFLVFLFIIECNGCT